MRPDFLIVGCMKGGTTSLCDYLSFSKDIYIPSTKEPHYFVSDAVRRAHLCRAIPSLNVISKPCEYSKLFSRAKPGQVKGESSVSYYYYLEDFVSAIRQLYGEDGRKIKIILVLRSPISRAVSQAKSFIQYHVVRRPEELKQFVSSSAGSDHFVYDVFGSSYDPYKMKVLRNEFDNVLVMKGEYLRANPQAAINTVCRHLGVREYTIEKSLTTNVSGVHRYRILSTVDRYLRKLGIFGFIKILVGSRSVRKIKDLYHRVVLNRDVDTAELEGFFGEVFLKDSLAYDGLDDTFCL